MTRYVRGQDERLRARQYRCKISRRDCTNDEQYMQSDELADAVLSVNQSKYSNVRRLVTAPRSVQPSLATAANMTAALRSFVQPQTAKSGSASHACHAVVMCRYDPNPPRRLQIKLPNAPAPQASSSFASRVAGDGITLSSPDRLSSAALAVDGIFLSPNALRTALLYQPCSFMNHCGLTSASPLRLAICPSCVELPLCCMRPQAETTLPCASPPLHSRVLAPSH